jgi:NAD(P)-dependent dehydrogenase (short-subunit alcohol dehydrogenase family)
VSELRFDGRVAVVTGAGRGLGRAYAKLLAARGASVVVNDLGASIGGNGSDEGPAASVVAEIEAEGGTGAADTTDVSTPDGAAAVVEGAVERYGRIDVLVNNAGIVRWAGPPEVDQANIDAHLAVHVAGTFGTIRAAWPHMVEQGYGRIVNTTSAGVFGHAANVGYATAKGGVLGMTRSLAVAGAPVGIKLNLIAPAAVTRMAGAPGDPGADDPMAPELAAPMVAYLAHEDCPVTGEAYAAGAGRFSRIFIASTPGHLHEGGPPTIEDVAAAWDEINAEPGYTVPTDLLHWSDEFTSHL